MNLRSGFPFWLIKNGLPFNYLKLDHDLKADVVIMGGGISGALVAWHLIEAGINCVVIDARTIGLGSTCASTSLLQYEIDEPLCELQHKVGLQNAITAYKLCEDSIHKLEKLAGKIRFSEFEKHKSLYFAAYKKDVNFLKEEFTIRKQSGFKVKYLEEEQVKKLFGFPAPAAILSDSAAQTNAYAYTHCLLQAATKKGLKVFDRTSISRIKHGKSGVTMKTTSGFNITAKKLVYATGYEAVDYIDKKIIDLNSTYACISEQANDKEQRWKENALLWNTANPYLYLRTTPDNRIIIGGRDEKFSSAGQRDQLLQLKTKQLTNDFKKLFPNIDFKPEFAWTGTFGSTKDGLPYIGTYKKLPNSLFALGFGGNGITFSLIAAEMLRDILLGKKEQHQHLFAFDR